MKKWVLWTLICTLCVTILLGAGTFFKYTGNKVKLDIPIKVYKENEYISWEENKLKENPDYDNLGIFIDLNARTLELLNLDNNQVLRMYSVAIGKSSTPSPIGNWKVIGKAKWGKGFGTRWMGLNVPWGKYHWEYISMCL
ncbi:L,D-transpeptidase [Clostridiaceae bacterium 35-E11]